MSELKFYRCAKCGNIIAFAKSSGVPVVCCGEKMQELIPNTTDASVEKHVPVVAVEGGKAVVTIGSAPHPMTEAHFIEWIAIRTKNGNQRKPLTPSDEPKAEFPLLPGDEVLETVAYCNLHGLWKK